MRLTIVEPHVKYVGRGLAVVNPEDSRELATKYVTVNSFVFPLHSDDKISKRDIGLDRTQRKDLGKALADEVTVLPTSKPPSASKIVVAPVEFIIRVDPEFIKIIKDKIKDRIFVIGQTFTVMIIRTRVPFRVKEITPSPGTVTDATDIVVEEEVWAPPPPPKRGFEKNLPEFIYIDEEEGLKIEEAITYRIMLERERYYFADRIEVRGSFVEFVPKLYFEDGRYFKPEFDKKILLPSNEIKIIEDPPHPPSESPLEEKHYVRGSKRQNGYFRKKPYTYHHPTKAQRKARAILARTAFEKGRNKFGKAEIVDKEGDVKEVPASAVPVMEEMRGVVIKPKLVRPVPIEVSPIDRLRRVLEILARSTARLETE